MDRRMLPILVVAAAALLAMVAVGAAALAGFESDTAMPSNRDIRTSATASLLHEARLDAARRARTEPLEVRLTSIRAAGFDGCLGVSKAGPCPAIFIGGYIAVFEVGGEEYRYHFGGDRWVGPVDPNAASGGLEVPQEVMPDLVALLAEYARREHSLRLKTRPTNLRIGWIAPVTFENACLGYRPPGRGCTEEGPATRGAVVRVAGGGASQLYSVSAIGVVFHDPAGETTVRPDGAHIAVQEAMRGDLAGRLGRQASDISVASFRLVTWSDGCLGVHRPGSMCTEALVEGFVARLSTADQTYRYHGSGTSFIATDFESGATISDPLYR